MGSSDSERLNATLSLLFYYRRTAMSIAYVKGLSDSDGGKAVPVRRFLRYITIPAAIQLRNTAPPTTPPMIDPVLLLMDSEVDEGVGMLAVVESVGMLAVVDGVDDDDGDSLEAIGIASPMTVI